MEVVIFKNVDSKPFTWSWNGEAKTFEAGEQEVMEAWRAHHYAKHLVDSLLNETKKNLGDAAERKALMDKIIRPVEVEMPAEEKKEEKKKGKKVKEFEDL